MAVMARPKIVVRDGRIRVDEPTDLPEGTVLEIVPADDDDAERARRRGSLQRGWAQAQAGEGISDKEFLNKLDRG